MENIRVNDILSYNNQPCLVVNIVSDDLVNIMIKIDIGLQVKTVNKSELSNYRCDKIGKYCVNNICTARCEPGFFDYTCKMCELNMELKITE